MQLLEWNCTGRLLPWLVLPSLAQTSTCSLDTITSFLNQDFVAAVAIAVYTGRNLTVIHVSI